LDFRPERQASSWRSSSRRTRPAETPSGTVRVVDVDERLGIALEDGRIVRLVGLDTPVPSRGSPETATAARRFLIGRLLGREVELDLMAGGMDRWGRVLADVAIPETSAGTAGSTAIALLAAGHARVRPEFEARACAPPRLAAEDAARRARLGLWRDPAYAIVQASDAAALKARDGQFVVIEGRVRRVGFARSRLYLDLVPHDGPTVVIARKLAPALAEGGRSVEGLAGEVIRVRGALDDRPRPRIEVSEPAMIEVVRAEE
jgi:endonuclease YncB( thermonuclease family)